MSRLSIRIVGQPKHVDTVVQQIETLFEGRVVRSSSSRRRNHSKTGEVAAYITIETDKKGDLPHGT